MSKKQKIFLAVGAVVLAILVAAAFLITSHFKSTPVEGGKDITFTVVYEDGSNEKFSISTDAPYLADALLEEKLITAEEYATGFYTVINGVTASWDDNAWWCITEGGEMTSVGMNELVIEDGKSFEATYTKG